jgi:hypothetical protein
VKNTSESPCSVDAQNAEASPPPPPPSDDCPVTDDDPSGDCSNQPPPDSPDGQGQPGAPQADCSHDGVQMDSGWFDKNLVGAACDTDGDCNPCHDGSGLMCVANEGAADDDPGECQPGCGSNAQCHGDDTCDTDAQTCSR